MGDTRLEKKAFGALIGSAIGDAMGGPVEFWSAEDIRRVHGTVDRLLPYPDLVPSPHGAWTDRAGSCTDDTRLSRLLCEAAIEAGRLPTAGDLRRTLTRRFHAAASPLEAAFLEEYAFKAMYGDEKQVFGGQPTNAGVMAVSPFGVLAACDPGLAFEAAYSALFYVEGYARISGAIAAAAVAAAMGPDADPESVLEEALDAVRTHRRQVEGTLWRADAMHEGVAEKNETLLREASRIARNAASAEALRRELLAAVAQPFGADGAESLAIGFAMFLAAGGDYRGTVEGCVAFGRDNDSSASFGGALAGALNGRDGIPEDWIRHVASANPGPSFEVLAEGLHRIVRGARDRHRRVAGELDRLLGTAD